MADEKPYRLPGRPSRSSRPDPDELKQRLDQGRAREARIQAGRDGRN